MRHAFLQSLVTAFVLLGLALPTAALERLSITTLPSDGALEQRLRSASLVALADAEGQTAPDDIVAAALADYRRLLDALYEEGFYGAVIRISVDGREAASLDLLNLPARIDTVSIRVTPGPRFRFGQASIGPLADGTALPEGFRTGQVAGSGVIRDAAKTAIDGWRDSGHAKAAPSDQSFTANHRAARLDAAIRIAPGQRLRFGDLVIASPSAVRDARLRRIAGLPEGAVFAPSTMEQVAQRLRRTGAFSSVALREADKPNADGTLDVELRVVDAKPRRFGFGAEVASLEGLTLSAFWLHRNLSGGAERLRVDGEIAQIGGQSGGFEGGTDYSFGVRLDRPAALGPDTHVFAFARLEREDEPDFLSDEFTFGLGAKRIYSDDLEAQLALAYSHAETRDVLGNRQFSYFSLPAVLTWDRRDSALDPKRGTYLSAQLTPFLGVNGSASGLRSYVDARAYRALNEIETTVLAGRFQFGSVAGASLTTAPPDFLFFSGGGGTVRGQPFQSLDVTTPAGDMGGRSFLGLSAEFRTALNDRFGLVAFADAGYVGAESFFDGSGKWHAGAGFGLRYQTGIGPIRFDIAAPVSGSTGNGAQIYLGIGQAF